MARMTTTIRSFAEALDFLNGQFNRKLGHNTTVHLYNASSLEPGDVDAVSVRYHATDIIIYHSDGTIELNTNGWETTTTKQRFNAILPHVQVWSEKGVWAISAGGDSARYEDGMHIDAAGTFQEWKWDRWHQRIAARRAAVEAQMERDHRYALMTYQRAGEPGPQSPEGEALQKTIDALTGANLDGYRQATGGGFTHTYRG